MGRKAKKGGRGRGPEANEGAIEACVDWLMENEFINIQKEGEGERELWREHQQANRASSSNVSQTSNLSFN